MLTLQIRNPGNIEIINCTGQLGLCSLSAFVFQLQMSDGQPSDVTIRQDVFGMTKDGQSVDR